MTNSNKLVLVIDHSLYPPQLLQEYIYRYSSSNKEITVVYSGYLSDEKLSKLPDNVSIEYLSRGLLPTSVAQYVYPFMARTESRLRRGSRPIRVAIRRMWRKLLWGSRKLWSQRGSYLRKAFNLCIRAFYSIGSLVKWITISTVWSLYQFFKPVMKIFSSVFLEWPLALILFCFPQANPKEFKAERVTLYRKLLNSYYQFTLPFFERRLAKFENDNLQADFEFADPADVVEKS